MTNLRALLIASSLACIGNAGALDLGNLLASEQIDSLSKAVSRSGATRAPSESSQPATGLSAISTRDQIGGLKQALSQGAEAAVTQLARENGYLGNDKVRIPLPDNLKKVDGVLRRLGMERYSDELVTSMNRAAEAAVPEAKDLLVGAVKQMTVSDAKSILTGGDDAATQYFRKSTETALAAKFKPIVAASMQKVKLAQTYDRFAGEGARFGLVDKRDAKLDDYITRKALDGLFVMMAEQERAIRAHPLEATGDLARKVFSLLRGQ